MRSQILVLLIALLVTAQSCCCASILGGPQPPYAITPSDEAVQSFQERMAKVEPNADGTFSVTITEEEMTSLVVQRLDAQQDPPPIRQPQVYFRNGRIEVYGTVDVNDSLSLPGMVAFSVVSGDDGISVTVEEISLGPLPVPDSVLESLNEEVDQTLTDNVQVGGVEAIITDVQIGDGEMTITGKPGGE